MVNAVQFNIALRPYLGNMTIYPYRFIYGQYGCLSRKQWKCSNLVKTVNWLDFPVKNESTIALMRYFPLYNFRISFIKLKVMAKSNFLFLWMFTCIHSYNWSALNIFKNMCKEKHPSIDSIMYLSNTTKHVCRYLVEYNPTLGT